MRPLRAPPRPTWKKRVYEALVVKSWWVFVFILGSSLFYTQWMQKKHMVYDELSERYALLEQEKNEAFQEQEELLLQVQSQSDPAWVEMTLKKGLGVTPEGQKKVYFTKEDSH